MRAKLQQATTREWSCKALTIEISGVFAQERECVCAGDRVLDGRLWCVSSFVLASMKWENISPAVYRVDVAGEAWSNTKKSWSGWMEHVRANSNIWRVNLETRGVVSGAVG